MKKFTGIATPTLKFSTRLKIFQNDVDIKSEPFVLGYGSYPYPNKNLWGRSRVPTPWTFLRGTGSYRYSYLKNTRRGTGRCTMPSHGTYPAESPDFGPMRKFKI